jgi:hypothetical protein
MLIAYAIIALIAVAGLIWAVNEHTPQLLSCCIGHDPPQ